MLITNSYYPADQEGGPPFSNRELARSIARTGARVTVLTTDRNGSDRLAGPTDQWTKVDDASVYYARTSAGTWLRSRSFGRMAAQAIRNADVCILSAVFWSYTGLSAWLACRRFGVPYVSYARGFLSPWALGQKSIKKAVYWWLIARRIVNGSKALVALADQERQDFARLALAPPVTIIPNGARVDEAEAGENRGDQASPFDTAMIGSDYFLFLGRIHAKKGLDLLLPAFERCIEAGCDAHLVIAGPVDRSYEAEFTRLLANCRVRERVLVAGTVSGAPKSRLIRAARAFVLSSYSEGLPVAVLEALSVGIPVVITAGCNLPEVAAQHAGVVVDYSAASLADGMIRIWSDAPLRSELSGNALRLARERFSWDAVGARAAELCRRVARGESVHVA